MKPHIRLSAVMRGVWVCYVPGNGHFWEGIGFTPKQAYDNWNQR
jgi:hypothetical protein